MLSLAGILQLSVVRAGLPTVVVGQELLDRPVRWVHVSDVPEVAELLAGGELILSTGLPLQTGSAAAADYLESLAEAGAAGLVVELGHLLPRLPPAAVAMARRHRLPLVTLGRRVRFVEVTEQVHRSIVSEQVAQLEFARTVHETFTRVSLEHADVNAVVATASRLCDSPVVLEDLARVPVGYAGRTSTAVLLDRWERRSRATPWLDRTGTGGPEQWLTTPVGGRGRIWGRLVAPEADPDGAERVSTVLERAAAAVELARMVERDRLNLTSQASGGLLADLAAGTADPADLSARALSLGLARSSHYTAVVVQPVAGASDPVGRTAEQRALLERVAVAVGATTAGDPPALTGPLDDQRIGVLLAMPPSRTSRALSRLTELLGTPRADAREVIGVGETVDSLPAAGLQLGLAAQVAGVAAGLPEQRPRPFYRSGDVRLPGLLSLLRDDPRLQAFVEAELATLIRYDDEHGTDHLGLLRRLVAAGGNKARLARDSHRSRPALYKQLARISALLGVELDDPASFLSLSVAIMAHDLNRRQAG